MGNVAVVADIGAAAGAFVAAVSRSRFTTLPPGPDPATSFRSTPASVAIRRARGDAFTRAASLGAGLALGAGVGDGGAGGVPARRFPLPAPPAGPGSPRRPRPPSAP